MHNYILKEEDGGKEICLENWTFSNEGKTALLQFTSGKDVFAILPAGYR